VATRRRRDGLAELVAALSIARPLAFASILTAMVEAAGEVPDPQWWQRWRDADITPASSAAPIGAPPG
jgi:hypothetical protein